MFFFGKRRTSPPAYTEQLRIGLQTLANTAFPKRCAGCGRIFASVEQYLHESFRPGQATAEHGDDDLIVVDLHRRCVCGAPLHDCFSDRRDVSEAGLERREAFGRLIETLTTHGIEAEHARSELLTVLAGRSSALLRVVPNA